MKTFKDIEFKPHANGDGLQGRIFFENGYGVSVVRSRLSYQHIAVLLRAENDQYGSYTSNDQEWELAVLKGNDESFKLTFDTHITDDVIGHLSSEEVTEIMKKVQEL